MIAPITLNYPPAIEFGSGKISRLPDYLLNYRRVFILADSPIVPRIQPLVAELKTAGKAVELSTDVVPEPPFEALEALLEPAKSFSPDAIVGIGGGSAMDLAKLLAILFDGGQNVQDIIGINKVAGRKVKLIAAATTAGTGSEVTPIAVLTDIHQKLKKGVVSPFLIPDVAIIDPDLALSLPPSVTAATGMDAMTHCIEAYTNRHAHPIIDTYALEGIGLIATNLEKCVADGSNLKYRTALALGSLYGGLCLGPVNTAAVHAMAYPLGGEYKVPHGVANSVLLPFVMNFNLSSCASRYARVAFAAGAEPGKDELQTARNGLAKIRALSVACGIPSGLRALDIPESAIPAMAEAALLVTRLMDNNPRPVALEDAETIYSRAWHGIIK